MMMSLNLRSFFTATVCMFGGGVVFSAKPRQPMNVILIMADDFGYECVGVNGSEYATPNLDRLAEEGMRFINCHSNPVSTPSRVQLMTGKYNVKNYISFGELDKGETTFGNLFQHAGYKTCIAGKWQLGKEKDSPQHFGFDSSCLWQQTLKRADKEKKDTRYGNPIIDINGETKVFPEGSFGPDIYNQFVLDFINDHKEEPFFVYYPLCLTHCPFVSTPDSDEWDEKRSPTYQGDPKYFPDMVKYTDKMVGKVLDEVKKLGLMDNTMIIFLGDNGTDQTVTTLFNGKPYKGGKGLTKDSGTHVPMFVYHPKGKKGVNQQLIDFTDFLPTLCEMAHISTKQMDNLDGISFYPQLFGKSSKERKWIYCWFAPRKVFNEKAQVFARNVTYKLYRDGRFYNVKQDFDEKFPIDVTRLDPKQNSIYKTLREAIEKYEPFAKLKNRN